MDKHPGLSSWLIAKPSFRALMFSIPWLVIAAFVVLDFSAISPHD